jgi:hypothetical protein
MDAAGDFKALFVLPPFGRSHWERYSVVEDPGDTRDLAK